MITSHWGVFVVNMLGSLGMGMAYAFFDKDVTLSPVVKTFIMTGLLGGFTTFSTYLLNFMTLLEQHNITDAFLYLGASVVVGCLFFYIGLRIINAF